MLLGFGGLLDVGNDPDDDPGQQTFTLDLDSRKFLDRSACMTCYEGNIAPFALANNASYQATHDFLMRGWTTSTSAMQQAAEDYEMEIAYSDGEPEPRVGERRPLRPCERP
jgi:hypothetical protein